MAVRFLVCTTHYYANGGENAPSNTSTTAYVDDVNFPYTMTCSLTSDKPTRTGYRFLGWVRNPTSTSVITSYNYTFPSSGGPYTGSYDVYAYWQQGYAITYSADSGQSGVSNLPSTQYKFPNITLTLSSQKPTRSRVQNGSYTVTFNANGGSCSTSSLTAKTYTTYSFKNWKVSGTSTTYNAGASYTANSAATMLSQWNTGSATQEIELPTPTKSGYYCTGWYTAASGGTKKGDPGGSFTPTGNIPLYAQWSNVVLNNYNVYVVKAGSPLTLEKYNTYVVVSGALQKYNVKIGTSP